MTRTEAEFSAAPVQVKPWGQETIFAAGQHGYVGKLIAVRAGQSLSLQYHDEKDETLLVVSGEALVETGPTQEGLVSRRLRVGECVHLPATVLHRVTAVGDLVFAEVSSAAPGWREDVVRLSDRYGRTGTSEP